jgi:3-hydroxyisobutyrate dehydrogenase-like beta-hydroxyacid dehydrogenase
MNDSPSLAGRAVGVVGLGLMGKPMARNLAVAGATVVVNNRSQGVVEELAGEGMIPAETPAAVVERADTVILMLPDTPTVEAVVTGTNGIVAGLGAREGALVIDMGTTEVPVTRRLAGAVEAAGGAYVDAPVSGGTIGAESGSLTIMAGGTVEAVQRALPIFHVLGSRTTHVGETGAGQVAKAANQVIVGLNIGAVAEALALAKRCGVDPARVREALRGGFADSRILEVHGQRMIDGDFAPGGKCVTQRKDLQQALDLAASLGLEMPATRLNRDLYDKLIAAGDGELDHAALIKAIEGA